MAICFIAGAGEDYDDVVRPAAGDLIIAADGGLRYWERRGMKPNLLVGDLDSLPQAPEGVEFIKLKREKDDTDTLSAVRIGLAKGFTEFRLMGCTGGRLDHTLANIQTVAFLSTLGAHCVLCDKSCAITAVTDGSMSFNENAVGYISVFAFTDKALGVYESGLKYELNDAVLENLFPIGVSNEFIGKKSLISVCKGTLIILAGRDIL
jgi:thiamine pyrophosphokinase